MIKYKTIDIESWVPRLPRLARAAERQTIFESKTKENE